MPTAPLKLAPARIQPRASRIPLPLLLATVAAFGCDSDGGPGLPDVTSDTFDVAAVDAEGPAETSASPDQQVSPSQLDASSDPADAVDVLDAQDPESGGDVANAQADADGGTLDAGDTSGPCVPGSCPPPCPGAPHASATQCFGDLVVVRACEPGFQDWNGVGSDGCEASAPVACDLYVSATAASGASQDGSPQKPFGAVAQALAAATAGCTVHVGPGVFTGGVVVAKPGILLQGAGPAATTLQVAIPTGAAALPDETTPVANVRVVASHVALEGLRLVGGHVGVDVVGNAAQPLGPVALHDVTVQSVTSHDPKVFPKLGGSCAGVQATHATGVAFVAGRIEQIKGATAAYYLFGLDKLPRCDGLRFQDTTGAVVVGSQISGVHGATTEAFYPKPYDYYPLCDEICGCGGHGGSASGIRLGGPGAWLVATAISDVVGAPATNIMCKMVKSPTKYYTSGTAHGIWLQEAWAPTIETTTTFDGEPVVCVFGKQGGQVSGYTVSPLGTHTNLGSFIVRSSQGVEIANNKGTGSISIKGCDACKVTGNFVPSLAASGTGILVQDNDVHSLDVGGAGCQVLANQVHDLQASSAMSIGYYWNFPGDADTPAYTDLPAQSATGLTVSGCANGLVADNEVEAIHGGHGMSDNCSSGYPCPLATSGAAGEGLVVTGSAGVTIDSNVVGKVTGGTAGGYNTYGGSATGLRVHKSPQALLRRNLVFAVQGGAEPPDFPGAKQRCIIVQASPDTVVDRLTCVFDKKADVSVGLEVADGAQNVALRNSIVVKASECAVLVADATSSANVAFSDIWLSKTCQAAGLSSGAGILQADPLFLAPANGDFTLTCQGATCSPAIDAGDPTAAVGPEPAPNGCKVNLGHQGGTPATVSKPGAPHCPAP